MTQSSYFWSQAGVGDYQSSYSDDLFALAMLLMFNYDRRYALIAFQDSTEPYLSVVTASAGNFVLEPIFALVDGRFYENDADLTLTPASGNGYYAVVLRRSDAAQTVRAALIYNAGVPPSPTQTAATWECVIAQGQVVAGVAQVDNSYGMPLAFNFAFPFRMGVNQFDWARAPTSSGDEQPLMMTKCVFQAGVAVYSPSGFPNSVFVRFPETFKQHSVPQVFVTPYNYSAGTPANTRVIWISSTSETGFTVTVDSATGIEGFNWVAIGPEDEERF